MKTKKKNLMNLPSSAEFAQREVKVKKLKKKKNNMFPDFLQNVRLITATIKNSYASISEFMYGCPVFFKLGHKQPLTFVNEFLI